MHQVATLIRHTFSSRSVGLEPKNGALVRLDRDSESDGPITISYGSLIELPPLHLPSHSRQTIDIRHINLSVFVLNKGAFF